MNRKATICGLMAALSLVLAVPAAQADLHVRVDPGNKTVEVAYEQNCLPPGSGPWVVCSKASAHHDGTYLNLEASAFVANGIPDASCAASLSTGEGDSDSGNGCYAAEQDAVYSPNGASGSAYALSCISVQCFPAFAAVSDA